MQKILIADDEVIERTVLKKKLQKHFGEACLILTAGNGREALRLYEENHPQVLIFDIEMPGINGLEAARIIRRDDMECAIIFLTAFDEFSYAKTAFSVRALDYLLKPCDEDELINAVEEAFRLHASYRRARQAAMPRTMGTDADADDNMMENEFKRDVCDYIDMHYVEDIAVSDIADNLGYSEAYFCKRFKQYFGRGFVSYLTEYRLQRADDLIRTTRLSIKDIGRAVGYTDPNYFTKVFRRSRGVSPSIFREAGSISNKEADD
jgi:YesN/AraC family two-component response regulator